jgi:hypothetical protein
MIQRLPGRFMVASGALAAQAGLFAAAPAAAPRARLFLRRRHGPAPTLRGHRIPQPTAGWAKHWQEISAIREVPGSKLSRHCENLTSRSSGKDRA